MHINDLVRRWIVANFIVMVAMAACGLLGFGIRNSFGLTVPKQRGRTGSGMSPPKQSCRWPALRFMRACVHERPRVEAAVLHRVHSSDKRIR
jgi:hypothetical protein